MRFVNFSAFNHQEESFFTLLQHLDGDLDHFCQTRLSFEAVLLGLSVTFVLHVVPVEKALGLIKLFSSWTGITENSLHRIWHCCTPLQNVHQIHTVKNKKRGLITACEWVFHVRFRCIVHLWLHKVENSTSNKIRCTAFSVITVCNHYFFGLTKLDYVLIFDKSVILSWIFYPNNCYDTL